MALRIVSWNVHQLPQCWHEIARDPSLDVALLQEATPPPDDVKCETIPARDVPWAIAGYTKVLFRSAIARCSGRVRIRPRPTTDIATAGRAAMPVSLDGTLAVADIERDGEVITVVSAYARWETVVQADGQPWIFADGSAHRIISDVSALITAQRDHKIIVAGDFNLLHGYGEDGSPYWARRYQTVFDRMDAIGLTFVGPQSPDGRQAEPWPDELPRDSKNVPTYRTSRQTPATATRQLDFVFASAGLAPRITVCALNTIEEWGPSDHCRVVIDVADAARH